ncbi:MinD/ParA family protein [Pseudodesulfovibrio thermohalotolerans]|jgi:flagellar biosynthesis protein FlhG|uniref:MinD/ParA family protein n=1 Tax=Pseudodesulfovibrio thermohalotolerans TaxID=2880651 RepID=UPI002441358F|nr:MinD/ParA family protein [Pseudodesulfovibrio thermohalotolerans]WFS61100.1 MinD/ParA family protein [Pseudodesulfovibrio thermohalotolerans]
MSSHLPLVLSVTSGKGGVGKTNMSVNLAYTLSAAGKKVVLLDADLGLANVDVILGLAPQYNLFHLFHEDMTLDRILYDTPYGFRILPASSGVSDMVNLDKGQKLDLLDAMDSLEDNVDYLIVDTGAGINDNVLYFNLAVQERLLIITPEPTSLTDAYALIKVLKLHHGVEKFRVLVNMVKDVKMAREVYLKLLNACDHFLDGISLDLVGFVPFDQNVRNSVIAQTPFCHKFPKTPASVAVRQTAQKIKTWQVTPNTDGNIKFFWKKLLFHERSVA